MHAIVPSSIRALRAAGVIIGAIVLLGLAARLAFRADPRDVLRPADALFAAGRFYEARAAYTEVAAQWPGFAPAWMRLGIVETLRDEPAQADHAFLAALSASPTPADSALIRLYQGQLAARAGQAEQARQYWAQIADDTALAATRQLLSAELLLNSANYPGAEAAYRAALAGSLPPAGYVLAQARLALLRASSDAAGAQQLLAAVSSLAPAPGSIDWVGPLLPLASPNAAELSAALSAPAEQRAQLLGQLYLSARLYALAEAQFAAVAPSSPNALAAAAYAAYTRWSAGDHAEGLRRLRALAEQYPDEPRARALLALALLNNRDEQAAQRELETVRALAPRAPDTHLAWGQWYVAQHDYVAAADAYQLALRDAPTEERGAYALALARFYVDTEFQLCAQGRAAATNAATLLPGDARAWVTLAAAQFGCGDASAARTAAARAQELAPGDAEAAYYLGRALAALGERTPARLALIRAADSAPASVWRARAEQQIAALGL